MPGPEFFQTGMGKVFFEATMPNLARAMQAIAEHLIKGDVMAAEEARLQAENEFWDKAFLACMQCIPPNVVDATVWASTNADAALEMWRTRRAKLKTIPA